MRNNRNFDFVGKFKILICISAAFALAGLIANIIMGVGLDINFSGGTNISYSYVGEINTDEAKSAIEKGKDYKVNVAINKDYTTEANTLVVTLLGNKGLKQEEIESITKALTDKYKDGKITLTEQNSVDATVGSSFFAKSLYALALACLFVGVYVGFRFRKIGGAAAAITAIIALIHDAAIAYFAYPLFGFTIGDNFIAVMLTILGYSLNDTIVIYDRIRENKALYGDEKGIREIVNISINESFRRTLITSITTFVAISCVTVVALIFGLTSILSFSIPMSIGVIAGSYSSVCIAGPLYVFWTEHREKTKAKKKSSKPSYVNSRK